MMVFAALYYVFFFSDLGFTGVSFVVHCRYVFGFMVKSTHYNRYCAWILCF
jgi:bacteriorhodopsin